MNEGARLENERMDRMAAMAKQTAALAEQEKTNVLLHEIIYELRRIHERLDSHGLGE